MSDPHIVLDSDTKVTSSLQGWIVFISFILTVGGFMLGQSFALDKANARVDETNFRVDKIEEDRIDRLKLYTDNQIKLENRLTRIETVLVQMNAKIH